MLLEYPTASDDQLAMLLPGRSVEAIRRARSFVDSSHSGAPVSGLSELLLRDPAGRPGVAAAAVAAA